MLVKGRMTTLTIPLTLALAALAAQPETPLQPSPAATLAPASVGGFTDAADLLGALEKADEGLDQLQAQIRYDRTLDLEGDRQVRVGELFFDRVKIRATGTTPERTVRRFAVRFDLFMVGTAARQEQRIHVFDGTWYADKMPAEKKINRKEVVGPGQTFDPMKLGEGPMPIPIGQKRDDILARYTATLLPAADGIDPSEKDLLAFLDGTAQVRLVPKSGAAPGGDAFEEIRLWYRGKRPEQMGPTDSPSDRLLPRAARTVSTNKDVSIVQLINLKVNQDATIDASIMDTKTPEGWDSVEARLPGPEPTPPAKEPERPAETKTETPAPATAPTPESPR
jgi:hypothetical protein